MRSFDFSSWEGVLTTVLGLVLFTLLGMGIRLIMMMTIQQRQQRLNRQINERLKTLIAAYKTLGGSFTGRLEVSPAHKRDRHHKAGEAGPEEDVRIDLTPPPDQDGPAAERARQIRDAVEAALSDIILLGTEEQVRLASIAAGDMVAGKSIRTGELVVSLRDFIREALDLAPISSSVTIPLQGPSRPSAAGNRGKSGAAGGGSGGGGGGGMGGMGGGGMGMGPGGRTGDESAG
ncbi:hypothetical protein [Devosia sp.]|uniref:hypothetical protein n=1 Tax=Devosia sp. TaxID=1871048 RepID=UPI002AFF7E6A|nr:hypothetical protein [Devosia sp.]